MVCAFLLRGESTITYTYGEDEAGPHAVSSRDIPNTSNDDSFEYDANGNMTERVQGGVTWTQTFDNENRLVSVSNGTTTTTYVYDGSGSRIKRVTGNTTTLYVAGMEIETQDGVTGSKKTIYYPTGGAFRVIDTLNGANENDLYYRHSDHLGSTSVMSDSAGAKVSGSEVVFAPFGETRGSTTLPALTDIGYTGQHLDRSTGATQSSSLMFYNARYYLPELRRFISADTLTPGGTSQALNRYTYGLGNPVNRTDPSGLDSECHGVGVTSENCSQKEIRIARLKQKFNVIVSPAFTEEDVRIIYATIHDYASFLGGDDIFRLNFKDELVEIEAVPGQWRYDFLQRVIQLEPGGLQAMSVAKMEDPGAYRPNGCCSFPLGTFSVDRPWFTDEMMARWTLAHEMSHALGGGVSSPAALSQKEKECYYALLNPMCDNFIGVRVISKVYQDYLLCDMGPSIGSGPYEHLIENPIFLRNWTVPNRTDEIFADVVASAIYVPDLLTEAQSAWIQNRFHAALKH